MINVGVIGLGVGEQHAAFYSSHQHCNLVGVYDINLPKAKEVAEKFGCPKIFSSFHEMCSTKDIDLISIASFDHHHARQVMEAINYGKAMFIEKPLCTTRAELNEIKKLWKNRPVPLTSNLPLRAAPTFLWLRDEIQKGNFGEIYAIDGEYLYGRLAKITDGWRKDVENYSIIEGGGIHLIDLIIYLTGQHPETVSTVGNKIVTRETKFRYHDYTASTFSFKSGLIARVTANFGSVHPHQHVLKVFGTKATFILDDMGPRIQKLRDPLEHDNYQESFKKVQAKPLDLSIRPSSKAALAEQLINCLLTGEDISNLTAHEFKVMDVCLAAVKSHQSGDAVKIP